MSETLEETTDLETTEAAAGADDTEPTPGAVADDPVEAAPTPASEAPEIDWNNLETLRAAAAQLERLGYAVAPAQPEPQPEPQPLELDPFADNFGEQLVGLLGQVLDQRFGPIEQFAATQQQERIEGAVSNILSAVADEQRLGELDETGLLAFRAVADAFAPVAAQRLGAGPQAARFAAEQAAQWLTAERQSAGEAAVAAYKRSIGEIADTPAEPAGSGGGLAIEPKPRTYDEIIAKHVGRLRG